MSVEREVGGGRRKRDFKKKTYSGRALCNSQFMWGF